MPLHLTPEHDDAIRAHAARDYPHECCGFLIGFPTPNSPSSSHTPGRSHTPNPPVSGGPQRSGEVGHPNPPASGGPCERGTSEQGGGLSVARVVPAQNTRDDSPRNRFEIDPGELVKVDRAARAEGLSVLGFYHSHPDAPAVPSHYDREHAWPGYCYIIVSVANGQPREMNNWLLRDDRSGFDPDPIIIEETP